MTWKGWEEYVPPIKNAPQPAPRNLGAGHYDERVVTGERDPIRPSKRSKYGAVKTTVDGITFDSKKEAERYGTLKLLERQGAIVGLELQPRFPLHVVTGPSCSNPNGYSVQIGVYVGDFRYVTAREGEIVEDVKGMKTALYRWKKKHVEAQYGITILET